MGDYGKIDNKTGKFDKEGNIYDDMSLYEDATLAKLLKDNPPREAAREDEFIIASSSVKRGELKLGVGT